MPGPSPRANASANDSANPLPTTGYYIEVENSSTGLVEKWLLKPGETMDEFFVRYALTAGTDYGTDDGIIVSIDAGTGSTASTETGTDASTKFSTDAMTGASTKNSTDAKSTDASPSSTDAKTVASTQRDASTYVSTDAKTGASTDASSSDNSFMNSME